MNRRQMSPLIVVVSILLLLGTGCAATPVTSVAESPPVAESTTPSIATNPATATSIPPTLASTPEPPTATLPAPTETPSPSPQPTPTAQPTEPPQLPRYNLSQIWGSAGNDVFAVGDFGTILHFDGSTWSAMDGGTGKNFSGVWGSSGSDVFVTGASGTVLHYNGSAWSKVDLGRPLPVQIFDVWGSSGSDVFVMAEGGFILHYDGATWSLMKSGVYDTLTAVWGSSTTDVFAVGWGGRILHYDGQSWSPMDSGIADDLLAVWGNSGSDVFAVGGYGTILHYNGSAWSLLDSGAVQQLNSVWGSSGSDVFAAGDSGVLLHFDGNAWTPLESGVSNGLRTVWGSAATDIFAAGDKGDLLHFDGSAWSLVNGEPTPAPETEAAPQPLQTSHLTVEIKREQIISQALAGNLLGDPAERALFVLLPPSYATGDKRYPVVYVMPWADGLPGDNAAGFKVAMESLLLKNTINEMIVVVPNGNTGLGASHFLSSPVIGDYETYLTQEVVDYVDAHYRTLPAPDSRGLTGCSNGGGPAVRLGLKYPNTFSVVAAADGIYIMNRWTCGRRTWKLSTVGPNYPGTSPTSGNQTLTGIIRWPPPLPPIRIIRLSTAKGQSASSTGTVNLSRRSSPKLLSRTPCTKRAGMPSSRPGCGASSSGVG